MNPLLVVNPASAGGRTGATFADLLPVIERAIGDCDVAMTVERGHAIDIARREASSGRELLVAIGGDGTFSEVVNGVMASGANGAAVATIAQGTGGDFRRTLGLEHRLDAYLGAIASGRTRRIDVGRLRYTNDGGAKGERYFVNILSAGVGGLVDRYVEDASPRLGGAAKYALASVRAIAACERCALRCTVEDADGGPGERALSAYMLAICNGRYFGAGMHVAPTAKIDDGRFEVVAIDAPSKLAFAVAARSIYDGAHLRHRGTTAFGCKRIAVALARPSANSGFLLDIDGEPLGGLPIEVEVLPSAITLRA